MDLSRPLLDAPAPRWTYVVRCRPTPEMRESAKEWMHELKLSTSPDFLGSKVSRREMLKWIFLGLCFAIHMLDLSTDYGSPSVGHPIRESDCGVTMATIFVTCMFRSDSLWLDYGIVAVWAPYCICFRAAAAGHPQVFDFIEHAFSILASCSGMHFSAQLVFMLCVVPPWLAIAEFSGGLGLQAQRGACLGYIVFAIVFTVVSTRNQVCSASLYKQLRDAQRLVEEKQRALEEEQSEVRKAKGEVEKLLDLATDGFCEIHVDQTCVIKSSSKLEQTLVGETETLLGMSFSDFLDENDLSALQDLVKDTVGNRELRPLLVTCRTRRKEEFDCKIIPYSSSSDKLKVCLQALGERRSCEQEPPTEFRQQLDSITEWESDDEFEDPERKLVQGSGSLDHEHMPGSSVSEISDGSVFGGDSSTFTLNYTITTIHEDDTQDSSTGKRASAKSVETESRSHETQTDTCFMLSEETQTDEITVPPVHTPKSQSKRPPLLPRRTRSWVMFGTRRRLYKNFKKTSDHTLGFLVHQLLEKINVCGRGCCKWHVLLNALSRFVWEKAQGDCDFEFVGNSSWQCHGCTVINDEEDRQCQLCGLYQIAEPGQSTPEELAEDSSECGDTEEDQSLDMRVGSHANRSGACSSVVFTQS